MTRLAFSMPPFTPNDTTRKAAAMKTSMNSELASGLVMKVLKNELPLATSAGASVT